MVTTAADVLRELREDSPIDQLFTRLVLRDVRLVRWFGEIASEEPIEEVRLLPANAGYLLEQDRVACRFDQEVALLDASGEEITTVSAGIVVDFHMADAANKLSAQDEKAVREYLVPGAWDIAYPFVREAVHTMSTRLGYPVALGVLNPNELRPQDVHVRGIAEFRDTQ